MYIGIHILYIHTYSIYSIYIQTKEHSMYDRILLAILGHGGLQSGRLIYL